MKDKILQVGCIVLYAASIALWALTGFFYLFAALLVLHVSEYFIIGGKVGEQAGLSKAKAFLLCLAFGFTWWLPLKKKQERGQDNEQD